MTQDEKNFLGCLLMDNRLFEEIKINNGWISKKCQTILDRFEQEYQAYQKVETKQLADLMPEMAVDIVCLKDSAHVALFGKYQDNIENEWKIKKIRKEVDEILQKTNRLDTHQKDLVQDLERLLTELETNTTKTYSRIGEFCQEVTEEIEKAYHEKAGVTGVPSGFHGLDAMTSGFQKQNLIIVGARPSIGKSAFASTIIQNLSVTRQWRSGVFSLEMGAKEYLRRIIAGVGSIGATGLRNGCLKAVDFTRLTEAMGKIYEAPIYINDKENIGLMDLKNEARRMKRHDNIQILFIDYIGLINNGGRNVPRHEQMAEVSRELKSLARELDIPIVALSQVGRQAEGKIPTLADLRETGAIEQDADLVIFLHRDEQENILCLLSKQRNGPIGSVNLYFRKDVVKFENKMGKE